MRALVYDSKEEPLTEGGEELLGPWQASPESLSWANHEKVTEAQRSQMFDGVFRLHFLGIQDTLRERHPPKAERFHEILFTMLRGLDAEAVEIQTGCVDLSLFIGPNFLVTRHAGPSVSADRIWKRLSGIPPLSTSPEVPAMLLLERVVHPYLPILHALEPRLEVLEHEIFENPGDGLLSELTACKSKLKQLRRVFTYHAQELEQMREYGDLDITTSFAHELNNIQEQVARCESLAVLYYQLASAWIDAYLTTSAHRLSQVMEVLTVITVIFVALSFLAGIYGMNFENMPELKLSSGYFMPLGTMSCVVAVQLVLFRRKRWF